jgi:hypothetical protein
MEFYPGFESQPKRKYTKRQKPEYENGYLPKIEYWNDQFKLRIAEGKLDDAQQCLNKINYFIIRQKELNAKK